MELITMNLADIIPYENNPRLNDQAVEAVKQSIKQCGYVAPIIVDENNVVLAGHTRLKALVSLGGGTNRGYCPPWAYRRAEAEVQALGQ